MKMMGRATVGGGAKFDHVLGKLKAAFPKRKDDFLRDVLMSQIQAIPGLGVTGKDGKYSALGVVLAAMNSPVPAAAPEPVTPTSDPAPAAPISPAPGEGE